MKDMSALSAHKIDGIFADALRHAWGQLPPSPLVKLQTATQQDPSRGLSIFLLLSVHIQKHEVSPPCLHGRVLRRGELRDTVRMEMINSPPGENVVVFVLEELFRKMSYLLREHDPRFGQVLSVGQTKNLLPRSPLFDPPRLRPPAWRGGTGIDAVPCPFCQDGFGRGDPAMWGGGNVMWVHPRCMMRSLD